LFGFISRLTSLKNIPTSLSLDHHRTLQIQSHWLPSFRWIKIRSIVQNTAKDQSLCPFCNRQGLTVSYPLNFLFLKSILSTSKRAGGQAREQRRFSGTFMLVGCWAFLTGFQSTSRRSTSAAPALLANAGSVLVRHTKQTEGRAARRQRARPFHLTQTNATLWLSFSKGRINKINCLSTFTCREQLRAYGCVYAFRMVAFTGILGRQFSRLHADRGADRLECI
jgi:hypothetical protein